MQRVYKLLFNIKERPIAFLGKKSLERLEFSLAGYIYGVYECEGTSLNEFQNRFNDFVAGKPTVMSLFEKKNDGVDQSRIQTPVMQPLIQPEFIQPKKETYTDED